MVTRGGPAVSWLAGPVPVAVAAGRGVPDAFDAFGGFGAADVQPAKHPAAKHPAAKHPAAKHPAANHPADRRTVSNQLLPRRRGLRVIRKGCKTTVNGR
jgi:hypothetical protein